MLVMGCTQIYSDGQTPGKNLLVDVKACFVQVTGMACRVSCATPVLGTAFGVFGVGFASALAGQASIWCRNHPLDLKKPLTPDRHTVVLQDALLDAVIGVTLFKVISRVLHAHRACLCMSAELICALTLSSDLVCSLLHALVLLHG